MMSGNVEHWQNVYTTKGDMEVSWHEEVPELSLRLIAEAEPAGGSVVDIGGGASRLVDQLLARGHSHVTVLDISASALARSRERIGMDDRVEWIVADVTRWQPKRRFDVWHDRAAFHFLTDPGDRAAYLEALDKGTGPGSRVIIGTFALDGPEKCSGLPVMRYDAESLAAVLGPAFDLRQSLQHEHATPWGGRQLFHFGIFDRR